MTATLILDASFTFRLILPGSHQARIRALMTDWEQAGYSLYAPTLWLYEITSALCKTIHFGALTADEGEKALDLAQKLNLQLVQPDETQTKLAFDWTRRLNRAAACDSFCLALAEILQANLWTADKRLYQAAKVAWVHWVGD